MTDSLVVDQLFASKQNDALAASSSLPSRSRSSSSAAAVAPVDFSSSLLTWKEIQLPTVQANLESLTPALVEAQKEALVSRKKLAEQTREFKKLEPAAQPEAIKPLLKAYQSEIDNLTKRAKTAENAVLSVRDRLQGAADPYPIFELVVEQTAIVSDVEGLREQVKRLQLSNASFESQLSSLPSLEAERSRLLNRVSQLESLATETRKTIEAESSAKWDERIRNYQAREDNLNKSLELAQSQLKDLRANYAKVTERLLQHGEEVEREQSNGNIEELDVLSEELSRATERAVAAEKRNEQLRQQIEQLKNGHSEDQRISELERRALDAEEEARRLGRLLDSESKKIELQIEPREARIRELAGHLQEKERHNEGLRQRLSSMGDYDEIKRELEIVKYVEFAIESDEQIEDDEHSGLAGSNGRQQDTSAAKPLEALLIEKNKKLQDELTSLRVSNTELLTKAGSSVKELESVKTEAARLKKLNERLEDDLINVKGGQNKVQSAAMSAEEALAEMEKLGGTAKGEASSETLSKTGATPATRSSNASPAPSAIPFETSAKASASGAGNSSSASSILPIITSQRDRFRQRNAELEEELRKQFATITELRNEVKTLQADNLGLYEKVRYLQAYHVSSGTKPNAASGIRGNIGSSSRVINMAAAARNDYGNGGGMAYPPAAGEDKYRDKYEAAMNPFEQFRGREQSRAFSALHPLERALHMATRLILGHRRTRIFIVVYAICLHLLVFAMLFEVEFSSGSPAPIGGTTPAHHR